MHLVELESSSYSKTCAAFPVPYAVATVFIVAIEEPRSLRRTSQMLRMDLIIRLRAFQRFRSNSNLRLS
ncbi:Hypothetical predicted protein [Octopus vulgaris]|uniref:Uncharacterized protein n=1 Tax=Octopus vulgaris TaxID=6645 RepID=A0AA36BMY2_OCTVU|nr:Hypothetical predicted protein [Octopus vulgaris]